MMTHMKRIAFLVIAVPVIFSFPDSVFSSQMSTEPVLDHAWREHEYPSYSFASLQYPPTTPLKQSLTWEPRFPPLLIWKRALP
jgi:hypothetical protein